MQTTQKSFLAQPKPDANVVSDRQTTSQTGRQLDRFFWRTFIHWNGGSSRVLRVEVEQEGPKKILRTKLFKLTTGKSESAQQKDQRTTNSWKKKKKL